MSLEFFDLLELREQWHEFHRIGDRQGLTKAESLARLGDAALATELHHRLARLPVRMRDTLQLPERDWEARLAAAALDDGFRIEKVTLALDPAHVQQFRDGIVEALTRPAPWGGILYFESAGASPLQNGQWVANLYLAIAPGRQPSELRLESLTGVTQVQGTERIV